MVFSTQYLVALPNGNKARFHRTSANKGYVYALGHRVYGTIAEVHESGEGYIRRFEPRGKWAFIVARVQTAGETVAATAQQSQGIGV